MGQLDGGLVLRLRWLEHDHLGAQYAAERLEVAAELDRPPRLRPIADPQ